MLCSTHVAWMFLVWWQATSHLGLAGRVRLIWDLEMNNPLRRTPAVMVGLDERLRGVKRRRYPSLSSIGADGMLMFTMSP